MRLPMRLPDSKEVILLKRLLLRAIGLIWILSFAFAVTAYEGTPIAQLASSQMKGRPLILVPGTFGSWLKTDIDSVLSLGNKGAVNLAMEKGYLQKPDWEAHKRATFVNGGATEAFGYIDPFADTYSDFIAYLTASKWKEGADFWVFTYDTLRIGVRDNAKNLEAFVRRVKAETGSDKVTIVAHSQGCLVARYYAECLDKDSVESLILLAPPNHGVLEAYKATQGGVVGDFMFRAFLGDVFGIKAAVLGRARAFHDAIKQCPAIWQMLPDIPYLYTDPSWWPNSKLEFRPDPLAASQYPQPNEPILSILNDPDNLKRLKGVNIYIVQSEGTDTEEWYEVGKQKWGSNLWEYGKLQKSNVTKQGDGGVLTRSAHLSTKDEEWRNTSSAPRWVEMSDGVRYKFIPLKGVGHMDYCRAYATRQWMVLAGIEP